MVSDKLFWQRNIWTRWQCPAIKWLAKSRIETYVYYAATGGKRVTTSDDELVKFTAGN